MTPEHWLEHELTEIQLLLRLDSPGINLDDELMTSCIQRHCLEISEASRRLARE